MRYHVCYSLPAQVVDHDGTVVSSDQITEQLEGLACHTDSVLNYAELPFSGECDFRGGHPRLILDGKGQLLIAVDVESKRKLTRSELKTLCDDLQGQITDGIGAGCFAELSAETGLAVQVRFPLKPKCTQEEGTAWKPTAATARTNQRRIAAVAKLVEQTDADQKDVAARPSRARSPSQKPVKSPPAAAKKKPNFQKLFRLLAKPERDRLFAAITTELEACGNDLSTIGDRELPYGNFNDPKLLRLLLGAGLPPNILDVDGHSLLHQAAVSPQSVEVMLKTGIDVNRVSDEAYQETALHRAARLGKLKSIELLLASGADAAIKNSFGETTLDLVDNHSRDRHAIELLLKKAMKR